MRIWGEDEPWTVCSEHTAHCWCFARVSLERGGVSKHPLAASRLLRGLRVCRRALESFKHVSQCIQRCSEGLCADQGKCASVSYILGGFNWGSQASYGTLQDAGWRRLLAAGAQATDLTVDITANASSAQRVGTALSQVVNDSSLTVSPSAPCPSCSAISCLSLHPQPPAQHACLMYCRVCPAHGSPAVDIVAPPAYAWIDGACTDIFYHRLEALRRAALFLITWQLPAVSACLLHGLMWHVSLWGHASPCGRLLRTPLLCRRMGTTRAWT